MNSNKIEAALADLKAGKIIIVCDDESRENEGDFVGLGEFADAHMINFMANEGRGLICVPLSESIANKLKLQPMVEHNTESHETAFTVSVDHIETTTGISAFERALTIQKLVDNHTLSSEFRRPGHIFPLISQEGGVLKRAGHTEAAVDLARLAKSKEIGVICEIMNDDGTMARGEDLQKVASKHQLKMITIKDLIDYRLRYDNLIEKEVEIHLPTEFGDFKAIGYTSKTDGKEHVALVKGNVDTNEPILIRVHSECLTGDVFGSNRCDCGPQLHAALSHIREEGKGILLYMRQEGRGIGLINKLKAYQLQEQGYDTVEANQQLGFKADLRTYEISAQILRDLGVNKVRVLTNNPRKITSLTEYGVQVVERVPLQMSPRKDNKQYLQTKKEKLGHLLML